MTGLETQLKKDPGKILGAITTWANQTGAINLGQGYPEFSTEELALPARIEFLQNARDALYDHNDQQYRLPRGTKDFQEEIARSNEHFYGLKTDPEREVLVTQGACAAIFYAFNSLLKEDDGRNEVIVIEPFFNFYHSIIQDAGGTVKPLSLQPDAHQEWKLDIDKLKAAITPRTKAILLNSPMNPTGKVFSEEELMAIADILDKYDLYAVCDEVYEFYSFEGQKHIPLATIDGMKDRCIRVSSVGKTFGVTSWRVGYASGPEAIINRMANSHFFISCGVSGAFQTAATRGLQQYDFLAELRTAYTAKAKILSDGLRQAGFLVSPQQGGYFISADYSKISKLQGIDFVKHMIEQHQVAAVPFDPPFLTPEHSDDASRFLRFCVAKPDAVLKDAVKRLQGINGP